MQRLRERLSDPLDTTLDSATSSATLLHPRLDRTGHAPLGRHILLRDPSFPLFLPLRPCDWMVPSAIFRSSVAAANLYHVVPADAELSPRDEDHSC